MSYTFTHNSDGILMLSPSTNRLEEFILATNQYHDDVRVMVGGVQTKLGILRGIFAAKAFND